MPAPSNTTPATAININLSDCPFATTQNVHDAGTTYDVWYSITNDLGFDAVIMPWFYGVIPTGTNYHPNIELYFDPLGTNDFYGSSFNNCPFPMPLADGAVVYVKVVKNSGTISPAVLNIDLTTNPVGQTLTAGLIFITSASILFDIQETQGGFFIGFIDPATQTIVNFIPFFPVGEWGDILNNGRLGFMDQYGCTFPQAGVGEEYFLLYDTSTQPFTLLGRTLLTQGNTANLLRTCNGTDHFWVINVGGGGNPIRYYCLDQNGNILVDDTIPGTTGCSAHCATNDEAFLLLSGLGSSLLDAYSIIYKWNLSTLSFESNFAAEIAGYRCNDIIALDDDNIAALYQKKSSPYDLIIKIYDSTGATLHTYTPTYDSILSAFTHARLGYSADNPTHFWLWAHRAVGLAVARKVVVADGTYAYDSTTPDLTSCEIEDASPPLIYTADTCPIIELRSAAPPSPTGTIIVVKVTEPSGLSQQFDINAGGGLSPSSFTLADGEQQQFLSVPVGSGYSISEDAATGFVTTYDVSNDSPINNISVGDGETVTVTITNRLAISGGIYKIVPGKRNDTIYNEDMTTTDVKIPNPFGTSGLIGD